jgi:hypothetical protein
VNTVGVVCGEYYVLHANVLKPDLYELSKCRDGPQVVFHAAPFLEERSLVRAESIK